MCRGRRGGQTVTEGAGRTNCYRGRGGDKLLQRAPGGQTVTRRAWRTIYYRGRLADKLLHKTLGGQSVTEGAGRTKCYTRRLEKFKEFSINFIETQRIFLKFYRNAIIFIQIR